MISENLENMEQNNYNDYNSISTDKLLPFFKDTIDIIHI